MFLIMVWCAGVAGAMFWAVRSCRTDLQREATLDHVGHRRPLVRATKFLHGDYRADWCTWEIVEAFRKMFLTAFVLSMPSDLVHMRIVVAIIMCVLYIISLLSARPHKRLVDTYLAVGINISLICIFLAAMISKLVADLRTLGLPDVAGQVFGFRSAFAPTLIILIANMLVLLATACLMLVQLREEQILALDKARMKRAHRLRRRKDNAEVPPPAIPKGWFHLFLSHTWAQGEEEMRVVKLRLGELMPEIRVFLDKDDLKTGAGAEYVDISKVVLVHCTHKYLQSRACARELLRAVLNGKQLITILEPDASRGGLTRKAIEYTLTAARFSPFSDHKAAASLTWVAQWALDDEVAAWGYAEMPTGEMILQALFAEEPIEWNRFTAFQRVTVRLVAERFLGEADRGTVYVMGEVGSQQLTAPALTRGRAFHLYCSPHNLGAENIAVEMNGLLQQSSSSKGASSHLKVTTALADLQQCEHMLLYLTSSTWTNVEERDALTCEVEDALRFGVHLLLVHEYPSVMEEGASPRGACAFNEFWNDDWTPRHLLKGDANVYRQIAFPLKPGAWRAAGLATVLVNMAKGGGKRQPVDVACDTRVEVAVASVPEATAAKRGSSWKWRRRAETTPILHQHGRSSSVVGDDRSVEMTLKIEKAEAAPATRRRTTISGGVTLEGDGSDLASVKV